MSHVLRQAGDHPFLFVADGALMINGHSPQHLTWREYLSMGWTTPSDFRIAALVRHPVDRVISAYRYIHTFRPDLRRHAADPSAFLDVFLSLEPETSLIFDQHNLGNLDYIVGTNGAPDESIQLWHMHDMNKLFAELGLSPVTLDERRNATQQPASCEFRPDQIDRIRRRYEHDVAWFEDRFPGSPPEFSP